MAYNYCSPLLTSANPMGLTAIPLTQSTYRLVQLSSPVATDQNQVSWHLPPFHVQDDINSPSTSFNSNYESILSYDGNSDQNVSIQQSTPSPCASQHSQSIEYATFPNELQVIPTFYGTLDSTIYSTSEQSPASYASFSSTTDSSLYSSSPADDARPFTVDPFLSTPSPVQPVPRSMTTLFDNVPSTSPLVQNPYYSSLCQAVDTDAEIKNVFMEQSMKPNVSSLEKELYQLLNSLEGPLPVAVLDLRNFYQQQTSSIEAERSQALNSEDKDGYYVQLLNNHFDDQRVQIISRVTKSARLLQENMQRVPKVQKIKTLEKVSSIETVDQGPRLSTTQINTQPAQSPLVTRPVLTKEAIRKMEDWYSQHLEHPYPSVIEVEDLARAGGITTGQVKKWFANKRCRSKNTKTLTAIACRKRLQKLGLLH